jgi:K+-transporting ATPase ATPase A chain
MAQVYEQQPADLDHLLGPVKRQSHRLSGVDPAAEMGWKTYAVTMLLFTAFGFVILYYTGAVLFGTYHAY